MSAGIVGRTLRAIALIGCLCTVGCADDRPTERSYRLNHDYSISDPQFTRTMGHLLGPALIGGNSTQTLMNGDQIFPAMLDAIRSAKSTITFETFVFWRGKVGAAFTEALCERARNGVKVHVIIDTLGADRIDHDYYRALRKAGVQLVQFHPFKWYDWTSAQKLNNRTHRKLLIIDGRIGFTGGVGIADEWSGNADSSKHWRDTHYRVTGPVVAQLQAAFADNWMGATGNVLHGDAYFPELREAGSHVSQVFKSGPQGGSESMELLYLLSMAAAEKNIRLASAYYVPDRLTIKQLCEARKRGVKVQIIVPGPKIDVKVVRTASRAMWGKLLKAGVEIYEYQPTMFHVKQMIIDDAWVSIGSANLDNRSFRMNAEANLNVLDRDFALEQIKLFDEDLSRSKRITYEQWQHRPLGAKMMEGFTSMFWWLM
jgi:cardiolipin synthase